MFSSFSFVEIEQGVLDIVSLRVSHLAISSLALPDPTIKTREFNGSGDKQLVTLVTIVAVQPGKDCAVVACFTLTRGDFHVLHHKF